VAGYPADPVAGAAVPLRDLEGRAVSLDLVECDLAYVTRFTSLKDLLILWVR
jgi:hypothetical protein